MKSADTVQLTLPLNQSESHQLNVLESIVLKSSYNLGKALHEIKRLKLYRDYGSWENYLEQRFNSLLPIRTAYNHIEAYEESMALKGGNNGLADAVDQLSQNQLRISRRYAKILTTEERKKALIDSVKADGTVDSARFTRNLSTNPDNVTVGAIVIVEDHLSQWSRKIGTVQSVEGSYCNLSIDGEDSLIAFSLKEVKLIPSLPMPTPSIHTNLTPCRGKVMNNAEWKRAAIAIFQNAINRSIMPDDIRQEIIDLLNR